MRIMVFDDGKWCEVQNSCDFDNFYSKLVDTELPFKFDDCNDEEVENFLKLIDKNSACLDDYDYYNFDCNNFNKISSIYIFENGCMMELKNAIASATNHLKRLQSYYTNISESEVK